jgi:hypothetical protein
VLGHVSQSCEHYFLTLLSFWVQVGLWIAVFAVGLLPHIDNVANAAGFAIGTLLAYAVRNDYIAHFVSVCDVRGAAVVVMVMVVW